MSEQSQTPDEPVDPTAATAPAVSESDPPTVSQPAADPPATPEYVPPQFVPSPPAGPPDPSPQPSGPAAAISERPELAVGGAFAGGLLLALILKRLAR